MTTDEEEGGRQAAAMQPAPIKAGDRVRLSAGTRAMTVVALEDYGNMAVCEWHDGEGRSESFPVRSLARV